MRRFLILSLAVSFLVACQGRDEHYYRVHPQALQEAVEQCPGDEPSGLTCAQLNAIIAEVNQLALEVHQSPQAFGNKILSLQTELANLQLQARKNPGRSETYKEIEAVKLQLEMRLQIVKWLESPESK